MPFLAIGKAERHFFLVQDGGKQRSRMPRRALTAACTPGQGTAQGEDLPHSALQADRTHDDPELEEVAVPAPSAGDASTSLNHERSRLKALPCRCLLEICHDHDVNEATVGIVEISAAVSE
ncbi:hypothetical protein [Streptomyces prunicolor]|uniref:Uncharacterized protein n=1 Tax=Streptomyces prunicolor TaxID=67348 RepID=A0ABU4FSU5_9ACTN|nr:hypothetical protein [Streptomyces prunicolor]MDV7223632.1 hypothetical protein [Streptomyces prunicolor]